MRWVGRIFTVFRIAVLSLVLATIGLLLYMHLVGLPLFVQRWLAGELAKKNIEAHWRSLTLDLGEGLVATDAVFYEVQPPHRKLAEAQQVIVHIRPLRFGHGAAAVSGFSVSRARLEIPALGGLSAEDATARIRLPRPGVIEVAELHGFCAGLHLDLAGTIRLPQKFSSQTQFRAEQEGTLLGRVVRDLKSLKTDPLHPPEISIRFNVDLDNPREASLDDVRIQARNVVYTDPEGRTLAIDALQTQFSVTQQALHLKKFRCQLYGGTVAALRPCLYDMEQGRVSGEFLCTSNIKKLAPFFPPVAQRFLDDLEFTTNPRIQCEVEFSEATGTRPAVRKGRVEAAHFKYRSIPVQSFCGNWLISDGWFSLSQAEIVKPEGSITGSYRTNISTGEYQAELAGMADPVTLHPLLNPKQVKFLSHFQFDDPVSCSGARVRGNWRFPQETELDGHFRLGRWGTHGLNFKNATADIRFKHSEVTFSNLAVQGAGGELTGWFSLAIDSGTFQAAGSASLFPKEIITAFWPTTKPILEPYQLESPPQIELQASGSLRNVDALALKGRGTFGRGTAHGVAFRGGMAQFQFSKGLLSVDDFKLERDEGEAAGTLLWDMTRKELSGQVISTLNVQEILPIFGPIAVRTLAPYRFQSPPLVWGSGTIGFGDPAQTNVSAHVEGRDFVLVVPRAEHAALPNGAAAAKPQNAGSETAPGSAPIRLEATAVSGDLELKNNFLRLSNVDAAVYGGTLKGWGEFFFGNGPVSYRAEFDVDKTSVADVLFAVTGKSGKVSGLLTGNARIREGSFAGPNTIKATASAKITDGHLLDVPIFGLASLILNMFPGGLGNAKAKSAVATFDISDGKIRTQDMVVETATTRTTLKGAMTMNGDLDFEVATRGKGLFIAIDWLRLLMDARVTGKMEKPEVRPLRLP